MELKRFPGGRYSEGFFTCILNSLTGWVSKWFTVCSEGVYYTSNANSFFVEEMVSFSPSFYLRTGEAETGHPFGVDLISAHRILSIDTGNLENMVLFVRAIKQAMRRSEMIRLNRYCSFAPERYNCSSKFYIDGAGYFKAIFENLKRAKSEVFISGWIISAHFHLCRPDPENLTRFDNVIKELATRGVKVNMLCYIHPPVFSKVNSEYTQDYLCSLSSNIRMIRHPTYFIIPQMWSHHDKAIIIDNQVAFIGGMDIGYGRYDDQAHSLTDPDGAIWPGADYCNYRIREIPDPQNFLTPSLDRQKEPRLPWHDIGIELRGQSVKDVARNFLQQWNHAINQLDPSNQQLLVHVAIHHTDSIQSQISSSLVTNTGKEKQHRNEGTLETFLIDASKPVQAAKMHRMAGKNSEESDLFEEMSRREQKYHQIYSRDQVTNSYHETRLHPIKPASIKMQCSRLLHKILSPNQKRNQEKQQVLRSAPMWAFGLEEEKEEKSIYYAYLDLIANAKEFIYIENQFFISLENCVSNAIIDRILRAVKNQEPFRVVVLIPSIPGFDGEPDNQDDYILRAQIHYMYQTICRGQNSVYKRLAGIEHIEQYIQFFTLRKYGRINGIPVTEVVYVHSKLMIVDDRIAMIGSANINDRSMLGSRDTELNVLIEGGQLFKIKVTRDNSVVDLPGAAKLPTRRVVSKPIHNLRKQLYMEHFAISEKEAEDYFNNDVWDSIREHAKMNQILYREIFCCYPDDQIRNFAQLEAARKTKRNLVGEDVDVKLGAIKGMAILFQRHFLEEEDLQIKIHRRQAMIPHITFT